MDRAALTATSLADFQLSTERTLPVAPPLVPLLPDGALVRGRVVACQGVAAPSLALALVAEAMVAGAWLAVVDVPWLGIEAAAELGIPLERMVRVDLGGDMAARRNTADGWAELVVAVLDGFDIVVTRVPRGGVARIRRVQQRVQAAGAVMVVVGDAADISADVTMAAVAVGWDGVGAGDGHLRTRQVAVTATGRRVPRPRRAELLLPGPGGAVAVAEPGPVVTPMGAAG